MALPNIGPMELIIILVIVLLIFGVGRLADIGGALGKSIRGFKLGVRGEEEGSPAGGGTGQEVHPVDKAVTAHDD